MREVNHDHSTEMPPPMPASTVRVYEVAVGGDAYDHLYRAGVLLDNIAQALPDNLNARGMADALNDLVGQISEQDTRHSWRVGA